MRWVGNTQNFSRARVSLEEDLELQLFRGLPQKATEAKARLATFALPLPYVDADEKLTSGVC